MEEWNHGMVGKENGFPILMILQKVSWSVTPAKAGGPEHLEMTGFRPSPE
jgi:hypothetical protein